MSFESAKAGALGSHLEPLKPWLALAIHLLHERSLGDESAWAPYLAVLPDHLDLPMFWYHHPTPFPFLSRDFPSLVNSPDESHRAFRAESKKHGGGIVKYNNTELQAPQRRRECARRERTHRTR